MEWNNMICSCLITAIVVTMIYLLHDRVLKFDKLANIAQAKELHQDTYQGAVSKTPQPKYGMTDIESVCLDGVKYYILTSHRGPYETCLAPALMRNGRPVPCGNDLFTPEETR